MPTTRFASYCFTFVWANVSVTTKELAETQEILKHGKWLPESFIGSAVNIITLTVVDRSINEQIGVEALMLLPVS